MHYVVIVTFRLGAILVEVDGSRYMQQVIHVCSFDHIDWNKAQLTVIILCIISY